MAIFESEDELLSALGRHDQLVNACVNGEFDFWSFCERYHNFYNYYALDGHESDDDERALFAKYEDRIRPHRLIAEDILARVCSDQDAQRDSYVQAGRFGSKEALARLSRVKLPAGRVTPNISLHPTVLSPLARRQDRG